MRSSYSHPATGLSQFPSNSTTSRSPCTHRRTARAGSVPLAQSASTPGTRFRVLTVSTHSQQRLTHIMKAATALARNLDRSLVYAVGLKQCLQNKWAEIHNGPKGKAVEVLDSTRNRMEPFFGSPVLRRIFGSTEDFSTIIFQCQNRLTSADNRCTCAV